MARISRLSREMREYFAACEIIKQIVGTIEMHQGKIPRSLSRRLDEFMTSHNIAEIHLVEMKDLLTQALNVPSTDEAHLSLDEIEYLRNAVVQKIQ